MKAGAKHDNQESKVLLKKLNLTDTALEMKERDYAGKLMKKPAGGKSIYSES